MTNVTRCLLIFLVSMGMTVSFSTAQVDAPPACGPVDGLAALPSGPMLLFGEIHGTDRGPAAFGDVVCNLGRRHGTITVGLEISHLDQAPIDTYLASAGSPEDRRHLLAGNFWTDEYQDGRRSRAMAELLDSLRELSGSGVVVHVVAFDPLPDIDSALREEHMARNLVAARTTHPDAPFVVLVGNLHARNAKGSPWDPHLVPMGARIAGAGIEVFSIDTRHAGGTSWICTGSSAAECGPMKLTGKDSPRETPKIELFSETETETGYTGVLWIGQIEASPPAEPSPRPRDGLHRR